MYLIAGPFAFGLAGQGTEKATPFRIRMNLAP